MSTDTDDNKETFSMSEFLQKDMEKNPELYEALSTDLDDTDITREDYGY